MKRLFWLSVGVAAGASGTVWVERQVKSRLESLQPEHLAVQAQKRAVSVGKHLLDAAIEGRSAMRDRESELRARYHDSPSPEFPPGVIDISSVRVNQTRQRR
ncbi:MAG: hypothetical protein WD029_01800 [Microthrixaceae bacterium]